jgi:hypothetical protein
MTKANRRENVITSRQMPQYSNPQRDEKTDADGSDALTLLTTLNQRGHRAPYQRFPLILQLTSTSLGSNESIFTTPPFLLSHSQAEVSSRRASLPLFLPA